MSQRRFTLTWKLAPIIFCWALIQTLIFSAHAGSYGEAGCGPGSLILKKNSFVSQTSVQGTNAVSSPFHTTAIYSNLSNCDAKWSKSSPKEKERFQFIADNYLQLQVDISRGHGENLQALLEIHGCTESSEMAAGPVTKTLMESTFSSDTIQATSSQLSKICSENGNI